MMIFFFHPVSYLESLNSYDLKATEGNYGLKNRSFQTKLYIIRHV